MFLLGFIVGVLREHFAPREDALERTMNEIVKEHLVFVLNHIDDDSEEYRNTVN